ncbi:MAG: hypothetical protein GX879_00460 [Bacteroidales bacterium]|nr:hypothetical protein [Bacteroidales bacterium]
MKKLIPVALVIMVIAVSCGKKSTVNSEQSLIIEEKIVQECVNKLSEQYPEQKDKIERGVNQIAGLWQKSDGTNEDFKNFCLENYIGDNEELHDVFLKLERNFEVLYGGLNQMVIGLMEPLHLDMGEIHEIDEMFGAYSPGAHLSDDFFNNKIAFFTALNFPAFTLEEKENLGENWTEKEWAYARMGDIFTQRVPASLILNSSIATTNADTYIAEYNIIMGKLLDNNNKNLFPEDMKLITHWGLRDELKSNYNAENGFEKQIMIYDVMLHIINQSIPSNVINNSNLSWNPHENKVYENGKEIQFERENDERYQHLLNVFHAMKDMDKYNPVYPNFIQRAFDQGMELSMEEVSELFVDYISSPVMQEIAEIISQRLERPLQAYDIWYDGFKSRSNINEEELDKITRQRFPDEAAFSAELPKILVKLGWDQKTAEWISSKITVDASRGAGHAWGARGKDFNARLRTRIAANGMDYKGYNIAIHEFGHCVEQTITLHDVPYYMLQGVPNTAFTEAVAFLFQAKDLDLLGVNLQANQNEIDALNALDNAWSVYEIMGVSLVDQKVWTWMYDNPDANAQELREAVVNIAKEVWNEYYAPVFKVNDSPILAIYSHMISSHLYLSNYPIGHLIEFQIENYIDGKNIADEITRMFSKGRLIPQVWMKKAVGSEISAQACIADAQKAVEYFKNEN